MTISTTTIMSALKILDKSPDLYWWKNTNLEYTLMNTAVAQLFNTNSLHGSQNSFTDDDIVVKAREFSHVFENHDRLILQTQKQESGISFCQYENDHWRFLLGHKYPIYSDAGKLIGVGGFATDISQHAQIQNVLLLLTNDTKCLPASKRSQFSYVFVTTFSDFNLSHRESECLFFLIRGKTAKEIARQLNLSNRTVEKYLDTIKQKLQCNTKSEVIDLALHHGMGNLLLRSMFDYNFDIGQSLHSAKREQ